MNRIRRVLQLQKFYQIEKLRKAVKKADDEAENGTCPDLSDRFHIFGNTANTYIDIVQKSTVKPVDKQQAKNTLKKSATTRSGSAALLAQNENPQIIDGGRRDKKANRGQKSGASVSVAGSTAANPENQVNKIQQEEIVEVAVNVRKIEIP